MCLDIVYKGEVKSNPIEISLTNIDHMIKVVRDISSMIRDNKDGINFVDCFCRFITFTYFWATENNNFSFTKEELLEYLHQFALTSISKYSFVKNYPIEAKELGLTEWIEKIFKFDYFNNEFFTADWIKDIHNICEKAGYEYKPIILNILSKRFNENTIKIIDNNFEIFDDEKLRFLTKMYLQNKVQEIKDMCKYYDLLNNIIISEEENESNNTDKQN